MFDVKQSSLLPWIFRGLAAAGFLILAMRLVEVQIIKGDYYLELAEGNRIRRVLLEPARGEIRARGGEVLVGNKDVKKKLVFNVESGFTKEDAASKNSGQEIEEWQREYKFGSKLAHLSGYLGNVNAGEAGKVNANCPDKGVYKIDSLVGRSGLEEQYECTLSGVYGEMLFEVDSRSRLVRMLGKKDPKAGSDIVTNIDYGLQEKVAEVMADKKGAVVISDTSGEILALYSSPSFDPNLFVTNKEPGKIADLLSDPDKPFFNRVIGGTFHPGSVFKPFVAIAALGAGIADRNYTYDDNGQIVVKTAQGDFSYSNWFFTQYGGVEGVINMARALARSTDTFFYKVGELVGPNALASWAEKFGLAAKSQIDLPGEVLGLVPTPQWKRQTKGEGWFLGNTYHFAIGQGDLAVTPLAINMATNALVEGKLCKPKIVGETECKDLGIEKEYLDFVKEGMIGACSEGGTANVFFDFTPKVACKTGTAQTGVNDQTHAWFTVIAPEHAELVDGTQDANQVVATVLVEEGGEGSKVAAPLALDILKYWFNR